MGVEALGMVLRRDTDLRVPTTIDTSPVALRDWEAAVGTRIAARARPHKLERGVLWVRAASAPWAQELALLADTIVQQLAARGINVRSLRFQVGEVAPLERPASRDEVRSSPPAVPLPSPVKQELARVHDHDLRRAIAEAAAKNLGWQVMRAKGTAPARRPAKRAKG